MKAPNRGAGPAKTKVFLVDDHPIVRRGFQLLLGLERDLVVCGEADNAPLALEKILATRPDVAILDLSLKTSSGLDLIKQLSSQCPKLRMLVFTMRAEAIYAERALRAGAHGYITKEEGAEKAIDGIRLLMQGKPCLSSRLADAIVQRLTGNATQAMSSLESLSDRELEVLGLLGAGQSSRQIADALGLSIKTVESHREHIKAKLGLKGASELVNYAFNWARRENLA
jgi:DNA-binding NarL/FixJ family response regulator